MIKESKQKKKVREKEERKQRSAPKTKFGGGIAFLPLFFFKGVKESENKSSREVITHVRDKFYELGYFPTHSS
jgi:hypothetical protein